MLPYSIPTEYKKLLLQLDKEWDIENYDFFFYSKKLITLEKIVGKNGQKRDFASPPTELTKGGRGARLWLWGYFGKGNSGFEWVPYTIFRNGSFI